MHHHPYRAGFGRGSFFAAAAGLLWALSALFAHAQTAQRPVIAVGDTWQFVVYHTVPSRTPNRSWVITSVVGDRLIGTENGEELILTDELNVVDSPRQSETNARWLSFPLEVGKRWHYTSHWLFKPKASRGSIDVRVMVAGYEAVEVPAGTFEAFRLEATGQLGGSSPSRSIYDAKTTTTYWYAPAARAVVKSVHHNPYLGPTNVELVGFTIRP